MVVQILLLLIGVLLLVVTMQGGFIDRVTMFRRGRDYYSSGHIGGGESSRGLFVVLIFLAMVGVLIWMNEAEVSTFFEQLDSRIMHGDASRQVHEEVFEAKDVLTELVEDLRSADRSRERDAELASLGGNISDPVIIPIVPVDEQDVELPKSARWGYQLKCGEVAAFVGKEVMRLRSKYPEAEMVEISGSSPYKVILFTGETREEVAAWESSHPELRKGYLRQLPV